MTLEELLRSTFMQRAELVAGSGSACHDVTWCVPSSALRFDNYIMPGLLLLATRKGTEDEYWQSLVSAPDRINDILVSGVVLFSDRSRGDLLCDPAFAEVAAAYEAASIPLVRMPESTNVVTFMKRFVTVYSSREADDFRAEEWLRNLAFGTGFAPDEESARQYGYVPDYVYYCMVLCPRNREGASQVEAEMDATHVASLVTRHFSAEEFRVLSFVDRGRDVVAFIPWSEQDDFQILRHDIVSLVSRELKTVSSTRWDVAVGNRAETPRDFHASYLKAMRTFGVTRALGVHEKASFYDDWYMHMLLLKEPKDELRSHMEHTLGPILDSPDLLDTLANYLVFGESLKVTSEKMLIHVNTLKYRLRKISELLGADLHDPNVRFRLRMAITIERFLET